MPDGPKSGQNGVLAGYMPLVRKTLRLRRTMLSKPSLNVSKWQDETAERNRHSRARLTKTLHHAFPSVVLCHALSRRFIPLAPRLAIDSYWRAHPIRADRLARSLAALTGAPTGWMWRLGDDRENGLPATFRTPPAPYRERAYALSPGVDEALAVANEAGDHANSAR